jgi:hypothetical protein
VEVGNSALYTGTGNCSKVFGVGNANAYTISAWVSRCKTVSTQSIFAASVNGTNLGQIYFDAEGRINFYEYTGGFVWQMQSTAVYVDFGSWHHIMASFTNNSARIWVNGAEITVWDVNNPPSSESSTYINKTGITHYVGEHGSGGGPLESYVAELVFLDGTTITDPTSFGEFSTDGLYWTPLASATIQELTFGTNGFYFANLVTDAPQLDFQAGDDNTILQTQNKTLLHFDGSDASTTLTNNASGSTVWTANANAQLDTAQKKFGTASLLLDGTGDYASHATLATVGTQNFTIDFWVRRNGANTNNALLTWGGAGADTGLRILTSSDNKLIVSTGNAGVVGTSDHSTSLPDATWAHVEMVRSGSTLYLFQDGALLTSKTISYNFSSTSEWWIGDDVASASPANFNGWIDEVRVVIGNAAHTSGFTPETSAYSNPPTANNFTNNNTVVTSTHTPTNIFATWNPLQGLTQPAGPRRSTFSNGNRTVNEISGAYNNFAMSTLPASAGKYQVEITFTTRSDNSYVGIFEASGGPSRNENPSQSSHPHYSYKSDGQKIGSGTSLTAYGDAYGTGERVTMYIDFDVGAIWFANEGVLQNSATYEEIQAGTTDNAAFTGISGNYVCHYFAGDSGTNNMVANFGDEAYTDTTPTNFTAPEWNTTNIAATTTRTVSDPYEHWNNVLYEGDATDPHAITGVGFQPDFTWIKDRDAVVSHSLHQAVSGATNYLLTDSTAALGSANNALNSFDSDGFTLGNDGSTNQTRSYIAWCAKLGGAPTATNSAGAGATPTAGSVKIDGVNLGSALAGSIAATKISANTTLGMSCGTYTGTGSANETIATGLTGCEMIIVKRTDTTYSWAVWHSGLTDDYSLLLNTTAAQVASGYWDTSGNTSTLIELGTDSEAVNKSGQPYFFMAFAPSEFISLGNYEGNANADGTFVPTLNSVGVPIQPVWVLTKNMDATASWTLLDTSRSPYNVANKYLAPDTTGTDQTADVVDIVTGGLKWRNSNVLINAANTYIYLAIGTPIIDTDGRIIAGH